MQSAPASTPVGLGRSMQLSAHLPDSHLEYPDSAVVAFVGVYKDISSSGAR